MISDLFDTQIQIKNYDHSHRIDQLTSTNALPGLHPNIHNSPI